MKTLVAILSAAGLALAVTAADPPLAPAVTITLGARHGHVVPCRQGFAHTGGGNIDVTQPSPDTVVVTMTGVAVAGAHPCKDSIASLQFDLDQCLDVVAADAKVHRAKLVMEGRVIGLLRSHRHGKGTVQQGPGSAVVSSGAVMFANLSVPAHSVACGDNLSLNCREAPVERPIMTGVRYNLRQTFALTASHTISIWPCKAASAEFAPDPALDPLWISHWEPFHGANKKDFGFQVILRVVPENGAVANGN